MIAPSRDTHNNWNDKDPVILKGVLGFTKNRLFDGSLEYFIGDGVHKYSELPKYGGAEASSTKKNNTLVLRNGNGKIDSASLPDATPTSAGAVKASTSTAADNVVKADSNGSLEGWDNAIANAIADPDNGLVVNPQTGKLNVDFDQMPTDKFEALLKSLKMLIPLEQNLDLYVDTNSTAAGDTIIDGRGTEAKPFKTIQAAVNYVTETYSIGPHTVYIRVKAGTYNEGITLPLFARTSGHIEIIANSGARDVISVTPTDVTGRRVNNFQINGGFWYLVNLDIRRTESPTTASAVTCECIEAAGAGTTVFLFGCAFRQSLPDNASILQNSNPYTVRLIHATNDAEIRFFHGTTPHLISAQTNSAFTLQCLTTSRGGKIILTTQSDNGTPITYDTIECSGSCNVFYRSFDNARMGMIGGAGTLVHFTGTMTGVRYQLTGGSNTTVSNGAADFFPGDSAGSVESATYCFYS